MLGRLSPAGADELVTCQVGFTEVNGATMKLAEVPVEVLPDALDALGEYFQDAGMICVVLGLLTFFCGEDMSF